MIDEPTFYEISPASLNRQGEELCGDQVKVLRGPKSSILVLSDGLGSGIKAAILARLTTEIIVTMLRADAPLRDVIETVVGTLPVCKVRGLAYATFVIVQIQHKTGRFKLINFDSPPPVLIQQRQVAAMEARSELLCGKQLSLSEGTLQQGDFLGVMSDGVLYANEGVTMNPDWNRDAVAARLVYAQRHGRGSAKEMVQSVMRETRRRYGSNMGDDATFVGVLARKPRRLAVFSGPPLDKNKDDVCIERLLRFDGRRVVCGGTTSNLVGEYLGEIVGTDATTTRDGVPPVGDLPGIDLVTEGIMTLARTLELLKESEGDPRQLPQDRNGAVLLARELLQADSILFLAGDSVNPYYQNPQLPRSITIRRSLLTQLSELLTHLHKAVRIEWF